MVFASHIFLLFLIGVITTYWATTGRLFATGKPVLIAASLFFYGYWLPSYLVLLLISIGFNYLVALFIRTKLDRQAAWWATAFGIAANLLGLFYYKYFAFLVQSVNWIGQTEFAIPEIVLPIGISFFTFHQIALLVEQYQRRVGPLAFWDYVLYIIFFPHLIAGPIIRPGELMPQIARTKEWRLRARNVAVGTALFAMGLFKKSFLIDPQVPYIDVIFDRAARGLPIGFLDGWTAAIGYSFQIYFDFSAYSDMALGLSLIFGLKLPFNFFSPYKATGFREFWRRWHITLSRFLRDFVYIPLGGSRHGVVRTILALVATMTLGGIWHGAGWQFLIWGFLHGVFLAVNHVWASWRTRNGPLLPDTGWSGMIKRAACVLLTFTLVTMTWVYFRSPDVASAHLMLAGMLGLSDARSATQIHTGLPPYFLAYFFIVWFTPNTIEILRRYPVALHRRQFFDPARPLALDRIVAFRLDPVRAGAIAMIFLVAWFSLSDLSPFIYFQF